jgi:hypothetical protein
MLLKVHEHLALPPLEALEATVPDEMVTSMWNRVETSGTRPARRRLGSRWQIPVLAAAAVVLLFSTGFLAKELRTTRAQVQDLANQADLLSVWIGSSGEGANLVQRTANLAGGPSTRGRALALAFLGQDDIRLENLVDLLRSLPDEEVLFRVSQLQTVGRTPSMTASGSREVLALLERAAGDLGVTQEPGQDREIRAGDLADWLATSGLSPDLVVPKSPIIEIIS